MRLTREFYERNTILVARDLLGKIIVHRDKDVIYKGKIVESEAYIRSHDQAAHFNRGLTERTRIIDEAGGHVYIYHIYGMYQLFNVVTERKGIHGAVLIRAVEPIEGVDYMYLNRNKRPASEHVKERELINLTNGPGKLVMAMNMSKEIHYGVDLARDSNLWIEQGDDELKRGQIVRSRRINVDYAEVGKDYLLRFYIKDNRFVSKK